MIAHALTRGVATLFFSAGAASTAGPDDTVKVAIISGAFGLAVAIFTGTLGYFGLKRSKETPPPAPAPLVSLEEYLKLREERDALQEELRDSGHTPEHHVDDAPDPDA